MKRVFNKYPFVIPIGIIVVVSFIFLARLFVPHVQLVATPEFELHDSIQLSYASKWWYSQKLHHLELPLWSNQINEGFPIIGEGQTGIFFLPNILVFSVIQNPALAYNIILTLIPMIAAAGMYLWFLLLGVPWGFALLGGLTFALSGFFLFHLQHIALLQGFSLIPVIMAATLKMTTKKPKPWIFLFIIILSQQICTGFIQAVVIGGMFSFCYYVFLIRKKPNIWKSVVIYFLATVGAIGVSAIQFLPSLEFFNQIASWECTNPNWPMQYSFPIRFLLTFIHPFLIGNPALGTYSGSTDPGSIYWENIGYVGILPIALTIYGLCQKNIRKTALFFFFTILIAFLLMLGKFSPFYFVFNFFPLNLFRVPSRFIYVFALGFVVIAIQSSAILTKQKPRVFRIILMLLWTGNLLFFYPLWNTYHALKSPSDIHEAPPMTAIIPPSAHILRLNTTQSQRSRYFKYGSTDMKRYDFYKNTLMPNTNTFWNYTISDAYPSRFLKRPAILDGLFLSSIEEDATVATMGATTKTLLALTPTNWIISGKPIDSLGAYPLEKTMRDDDASLSVYVIPNSTPWAFFPSSWHVLSTLSDIKTILSNPLFDPKQSVIVEQHLSLAPYTSKKLPRVTTMKQKDGFVELTITDSTQDALLTIGMTYYPGWVAKANGKQTDIFPVNIRNMGIVVQQGTTQITFQYIPQSLIWGTMISFVSLVSTAMVLLRKQRV